MKKKGRINGRRGKPSKKWTKGKSSRRQLKSVEGRIQLTQGGYGFVKVRGFETDIFIPRNKLMGAFHNDLVKVKTEGPRKGGRTRGEVTRVIERGPTKVLGTFRGSDRGQYLKIEDKRLTLLVEVASSSIKGIRDGELVTGILGKVRKGRRGDSRVVKTHGFEHTVETLTLSTLYLSGLDKDFPENAKEESLVKPLRVSRRSPGRRDLTEFPFITIDGADARDFDDAVCLVNEGNKKRLLVSIADVSSYVREGDSLDREGRRRGTSAYFPDRVVPMFPERLSNNLCSLRENVYRHTLTVDSLIDSSGRILDVDFYPSVIRSRKRLIYREVETFLERGKGPLKGEELGKMIKDMEVLSEILRARRIEKGSIDFDLPEAKIFLSKGGALEKIVKGERLKSHRIIEEFMLLANVLVAEYLDEKGLPTLYRIHEKPDPIKVADLLKFVRNIKMNGSSIEEGSLQEIIDGVKGSRYEKIVNLLVLRSLSLARYSLKNFGHFGLAFNKYTHFTSPIRRYPDLLVHRVLRFAIGDDTQKKSIDLLRKGGEELSTYLSEKEREAEQAERDVMDKLKALFMVQHRGKSFRGIITSLQTFGIFVELEEVFVEGIIPIEDLPSDSYYLDGGGFSLVGNHGGTVYALGTPVIVKVKGSAPPRGRVEFLLVEKCV